ncbi:MAG: isoprenylcysteine carboxylmethyltransferase family protein [Acidobacteria bacterium]|nr:isoprenylcysteine carboxylmethyltransferase family protein [Acidobacteriota bacterium]
MSVADEQVFRLILIAGAAIIMPVAIYHRVKSQATGESLDRRQEGLFVLATLRPLGIAAWLGMIAYMINPAWMAWSAVSLPAWLRWLGVGVGAVAGSLLIWTMHTLGKNLTDTVVTRKEHELVTGGPYRFVRHPFYCAFILAILANSAVAANWFMLLAGGSAWLVIVFRTNKEEENLIARFGDDYRRYMERTGRFFPRL